MSSSETPLNAGDLQRLYQYAYSLCQHQANAQDLLQTGIETFLSDNKKGAYIEHPTAYVRKVIRNRFIDHYRKDKRWLTDSYEEQSSYDISPMVLEDIYVTEQTLESIWQELSVDDRDILYHWAVLGYSTDEACQILNLPRGTFLSRIHRIRKKYKLDNQASSMAQEQQT